MKPKKENVSIPYPIRINRYVALKGYATRRGADELIKKGKVALNGKRAQLGDMVDSGDRVLVRGGLGQNPYVYLAYHKPQGVVTHSTHEGERDIAGMVGRDDVFPIGRLDKNSHGLMILTNDGRITGPLLDPNNNHEKEYVVEVDRQINNLLLKWLRKGVSIEGYVTKPSNVEERGDRRFAITLTEGKRHQIRRMCAAFGYAVSDLKRVRIMNIRLNDLKPNEYREIAGAELKNLLASLEIDSGRSET
jgi:23S rRNA pseudouridine2604 synthase